MHTTHYTLFSKTQKSIVAAQRIVSHFETVLISLLMLIGLIGMFIILGGNPLRESSGTEQAPNSINLSSILPVSSDFRSNDFDQHISLGKTKKANEQMMITFLKDPKANRFVLEMGNGERLIVTQPELYYTYASPGKYTLELKEIRNGLFVIIGTKTIKVK